MAHDEFGTRLVQEVLASSSSPDVIRKLGKWVAINLTAIFKSSPAVFLAKAVIQKLAALGHGQVCLELLKDLVISSLEIHGDSQPLLIKAALHPTGHGLAKEIVAQVDVNSIKLFTKFLLTFRSTLFPVEANCWSLFKNLLFV